MGRFSQLLQNNKQLPQSVIDEKILKPLRPQSNSVLDTPIEEFKPQPAPIREGVNPAFAKRLPKLTAGLSAVADKIDIVMKNPWVERSGQTGAEVMTATDNTQKATTGSKIGDMTADLWGGAMGFAGNPMSAGAKLWGGSEQVAGAAINKLPQLAKLPAVAQTALKLGGATVPYEATMAAVNNRPMDAGEMGVAAGSNALLGMLPYGIGKAMGGKAKVEMPAMREVPWKPIETALPKAELPTIPPPDIKIPTPKEVAPKEPWQMTKEEFLLERPQVEGYRFHGSPEGDLAFIDPYAHTQTWKEGIGFYTTNSRDAANMYSKGRTAKGDRKGKQGAINYIEARPKAVLDMDAPLDKVLWKNIVEKRTGDSQFFDSELVGLKSNSDGYKAAVEHLRDEFGTEAQYAIEESLVDMGITATAHMEGVKGGKPHQVFVHKTNEGMRIVPPEEVYNKMIEKATKEGRFNTPKAELPTLPTIKPKVSAPVKGIPSIEALKADMAEAVPMKGKNPLLGEGSISAAKGSTPGKIEPTGNPNEYTQSFVSAAAQSPAVDRNVKDILWWDLQPGESGTYGRRTHKMISEQADGFITSNPDAAYRHATSVETIANEPDLSVAIGIKLAEHHQKTNPTLSDEILNEIGDQLTKHGQAISASRLLVRMTPQGMVNNIEKNIGKLNKEGLEQYGKKWKDIELTSPEREAISKLKIGDKAGYEALNEQIQTRIADELPASAMEKVNAWRHISMLLNPKTQVRNVGGNLIMMGMRKTAKAVSAVLQKVAVKAEDRTQVISVKKEFKDSATAYFEANKRELLGGPNKYQENIKLNMPNKRVFQSNALDKTRKFTYKLLEMGDTPFFKNAYIDRLASFAQARGIKDFSKLPKEAFKTALKEAEQATYKDASEVATFLNKLKNPGAKANAIQKGAAFGLEAATPFVKTPINIIKRGIQYSPAGIINTIGKWKSAEGIDELAKGLTGTGILGLGYLLAKHGILTGKASEDADLKAYNANAGQSPFSIFGKYTYDWAQPFAVPLSVGVEIYNALKENPLEQKQMDTVLANNDTSRLQQIAVSVSDSIIDSLSASGDTVFNMSIMKGIKNLLGNPQGVTAGLSQLPQQYASQFIPTLSSQVAGMVDPTVRQSYEKGNLAGSMKNALLSKIPFASKTLPAKQSPYGEDIKRIENPAMRAFGQFLSPGIIATDQNVKPGIDNELRRLNAEGLKTQFPTITPNYIDKTQKHPRINLTAEEATQYQKRTGKLTEEAFNKIISSSAYQNAKANKEKNQTADEVKAAMLAKAIAEAKAKAKAEIVEAKGYK